MTTTPPSDLEHPSTAVSGIDPARLADRLERWPEGHFDASFEGRRYGVTLHRSPDGRRVWLYGEERGGRDFVSANLYRLPNGETLLRPCEMPAETVARFIVGVHIKDDVTLR